MKFNKEQLTSAWIFAGFWAATVLFGGLFEDLFGGFFGVFGDGDLKLSKFIEALIFWGIFAFLTHQSLKGKSD